MECGGELSEREQAQFGKQNKVLSKYLVAVGLTPGVASHNAVVLRQRLALLHAGVEDLNCHWPLDDALARCKHLQLKKVHPRIDVVPAAGPPDTLRCYGAGAVRSHSSSGCGSAAAGAGVDGRLLSSKLASA